MSLFPPANAENTEDSAPMGSLERMGISVETKIPEGILNPATAKAINFRVRKPAGYAFNEVDQFVMNIMQPTIDWYVNALYQRDIHVHQLGATLDQAEIDIKNLKAQAQFLEYNSQIAKGLERGQDDAEMVAVMQKLTLTEQELEAVKAELQSARAGGKVNELLGDTTSDNSMVIPPVNVTPPPVINAPVYTPEHVALGEQGIVSDEEIEAKLAEQEAYITQLLERYQQLEQMYASVVAELEQARAAQAVEPQPQVSEEQTAYIAQVTQQYEQLQTMYEELSQRYAQDIGELQAQVEADKIALANLQQNVQTAQAASPDETVNIDAETQAYIDELLARYNELIERYNNDTVELQARIDLLEAEASSLSNTPNNTTGGEVSAEAQAEIEQLHEYYNNAVAQYNALLDMYNQIVEQVEAGGSTITVVQGEVDLTQYVSIEEYQRVVDENETLKRQLDEALGGDPDTSEDDYIPQFMLPAEDLKRDIDPQKYGNLPPGIRPEDLE